MTTITWPTVSIEIAFNSLFIRQTVAAQGATWTAVTAYVERWGYKRGRQRQLGRAETGTAYLVLNNKDGRFDPENASSPYYNGHASEDPGTGMKPTRHVRIRATWSGVTYDLFYGYVMDWQPEELRPGTDPTVKVTMQDMLGWIGRDAHWALSAPLGDVGTSLAALFSDPNPNIHSDFINCDPGQRTGYSYIGVVDNLLSLALRYADSEEGAVLFVNGKGQLTFHDHARRYRDDRSIVLQAIFDNDATAQAAGSLPYARVTYTRDMVEYANKVTVSSTAPLTSPQVAQNSGSITRRGPWPLTKSTVLTTDIETQAIADRMLVYHNRFDGRHEDLVVEAALGVSALWPAVLSFTISDQIRVVERLYPGGRTRQLQSFIEGMQVDVNRETESWRATYRLSPAYPDLYWSIRGKGVAFPSSPAQYETYFRTDLGLLCYYDGNRWVTVTEYEIPFQQYGDIPASTAFTTLHKYVWPGVYSFYITTVDVETFVLTTNNGSNYWTCELRRDSTVIYSFTTAADSAGGAVRRETSINAVHTPTGAFSLVAGAKTGAPGNIYLIGTVKYRLVVT